MDNFWTPIAVAIVTGSAVWLAAWTAARAATAELVLKRRLESTDRFLELMAAAHGRPRDGRAGVGLGEQVAVKAVLTDLAIESPWLRAGAVAGLSNMRETMPSAALQSVIDESLGRLAVASK